MNNMPCISADACIVFEELGVRHSSLTTLYFLVCKPVMTRGECAHAGVSAGFRMVICSPVQGSGAVGLMCCIGHGRAFFVQP
jgi:hypothetical protein